MILRAFPRVDAAFRDLFWTTNLVIHARGTQITYTQHTTPLTIKAAWGGSERYLVDGLPIAVDDATYLVLNHGRPYASWIAAAARPVESLAAAGCAPRATSCSRPSIAAPTAARAPTRSAAAISTTCSR